ncbi:hypothetical protein D8B25_20010 [Verminephrobacter aporrectodeae subsp. tuberculatae]|nr:hypothetical protein [Verminephrobacter aporrectodeae subsp. tuberculatae]MCW8205000.1 hypothetical protein [Verminephrobacter aporrectodeae subsp. tuberculatae]
MPALPAASITWLISTPSLRLLSLTLLPVGAVSVAVQVVPPSVETGFDSVPPLVPWLIIAVV